MAPNVFAISLDDKRTNASGQRRSAWRGVTRTEPAAPALDFEWDEILETLGTRDTIKKSQSSGLFNPNIGGV